MHTVMIPVVSLLGVFFFGVGRAAAADPGEWKVGNWSGDIRRDSVGCKAMYFNPADDYSFILWVYNQGSRIRDSSLASCRRARRRSRISRSASPAEHKKTG